MNGEPGAATRAPDGSVWACGRVADSELEPSRFFPVVYRYLGGTWTEVPITGLGTLDDLVPAACVARARAATFLMRSMEPTEVLRRLAAVSPPGLDWISAEAQGPGRPAQVEAVRYALSVPADRRADEAVTLNCLGELSSRTADGHQARDHHIQALAIARELGTPPEEARALEGIGHSHLRDGNSAQAAAPLRDALAIYQRIGSPAARRVEETLRRNGLFPASADRS